MSAQTQTSSSTQARTGQWPSPDQLLLLITWRIFSQQRLQRWSPWMSSTINRGRRSLTPSRTAKPARPFPAPWLSAFSTPWASTYHQSSTLQKRWSQQTSYRLPRPSWASPPSQASSPDFPGSYNKEWHSFTIILLIWASGHLFFLVIYFFRKLKHGCRNSFRTAFAPTLQLQKLTEGRIIQNSVISDLQQKICENELAQCEFKENILDRLERLETRDAHM